MELKTYQREVIADLSRYLELLNETRDGAAAFRSFWEDRGAAALGRYHDVTPGVPNVCFKVPTGGGKTFLACAAIRPIFDALPPQKVRAVVWLVPSDAILTQTLAALKDPSHPYRQKLDASFGGRVEIYGKQELLSGQNFNSASVMEQLSVMVLSYDSFRGRGKEALKAYQENSSLTGLSSSLGDSGTPIEKADETSLFRVINKLFPLVIVDESHHARTELSLEMLKNFNPCFVLDLTATPREESNVISYVDAYKLKAENMVKLPVIVVNRASVNSVIANAIETRSKLEKLANRARRNGGRYIRPIVLLQAQPRLGEESETFERLRSKLTNAGIPAEQIAVRTGDINELKGVDLMSAKCPVRFIITVNALKEGWDCPFAYILASTANRTSRVDVEQIVGRILRLPHASRSAENMLNTSYIITSSADFNAAVQQIVRGLNDAGFSSADYRLAQLQDEQEETLPPEQLEIVNNNDSDDLSQQSDAGSEDDAADDDVIAEAVRRSADESDEDSAEAAELEQRAEELAADYDKNVQSALNNVQSSYMPAEVRDKVKGYRIKPEFAAETEGLMLPQFFEAAEASLFGGDNALVFFEKEHMAKSFTLKGKPYDIDFSDEAEITAVDVRDGDEGMAKAFRLNSADRKHFMEWFSSLPGEAQIRRCRDIMIQSVSMMDTVSDKELRTYIDRIISDMDADSLAMMRSEPLRFADKIKSQVKSLLEDHYRETFQKWLDTERIVCRPCWHFPKEIYPVHAESSMAKSLYTAEDGGMNKLERDFVMRLTGLENVRWWHRNISRQGFALNGFINHYPDIIIMTESGRIIAAETKGAQLNNKDSAEKIELGAAWEKEAGKMFRYYMVFADGVEPPKGALSMKQFAETVSGL